MNELPDEMIMEICTRMETPALARFLATNERHYRICANILERRRRNASLKRIILNRAHSEAIFNQKAIDLTALRPDGNGIRVIPIPSERSTKVKLDEGIYVSPARAQEMLEILNSE